MPVDRKALIRILLDDSDAVEQLTAQGLKLESLPNDQLAELACETFPLLCRCGSGEEREAIYDGHGIYLCRACDQCRQEKLSHYRSDIMGQYECDEPIEDET